MTDRQVRNILEERARRTLGSVVPEHGDPINSAEFVTRQQVAGAKQLLSRDISRAPRWAWQPLDALTGAMLSGDFIVVGSLMGNGKSTLLMSQMDAFAERQISTFYMPLEIDPEVCRMRWAAWRLNLEAKHVVRHEWHLLGRGAEDAVNHVLDEQEKNPFIHFAPCKRPSLPAMVKWCQWAKREFDPKVIMLDHFHRVDIGSTNNHRVSATDAVRQLKDLARDLDLAIIAASQLNRSSDPIDMYTAPILSRLKETSALGEEADVVLMLSRRLRRDLPDGWQQDLKLNRITENDLGERNVMVVTCRKHRLDDSALNGRVLLTVEQGRIVGQRT